MATIPWTGPGRMVTLTIPNGGTTSDVLDLGAFPSFRVSGSAAAGGSTTSVVAATIQAGAVPMAFPVDHFKDKLIVFKSDTTTANLRDQIRRITASTAAGVLTVAALTDAPVAGDTFEIISAVGGPGSYWGFDISIHTAPVVTGTVNIQLSPTETGTFQNLQSGGADITLAAAKVTPVIPMVGRYLRLLGGAQGQITRFTIVGTARNLT